MNKKNPTDTIGIIKASAGSGKTYRLTHEFVSMILDQNIPWRGILAVTFTNKAAAEMKGRILEALRHESEGSDARSLRAKEILEDMLLHYGELHVGTIDSYLQGASGAVSGDGRRIDLDEDGIIREAVDRVFEDAAGDAALQRRLRTLAMRRIEDGRGWNMQPMLACMVRSFLDEQFLVSLLEEDGAVRSPEKTEELAERAARCVTEFEAKVAEVGRKGLSAMEAVGRAPEEYKGKSRSPMTAFRHWAAGTVKEPGVRFATCLDETEGTPVQAAVAEAVDLFDSPYREYRTAKVVAESIPGLTLWSAIWKALDATLENRGVAMLRRNAARLAAASDDDEGYIQERMGVAIEAMLVDEAQDTSALQWRNLRRVARETLRRGGIVKNVGDVKQSIYRWRGADSRLLAGGMQASMPEAAFPEETLGENWRSTKAVVETNNALFGAIAARSGDVAPAEAAAMLAKVYGDACQELPAAHAGGNPGYARIMALSGEDWMQKAAAHCIDDIIRMRSQGYRWRDITVLVRRNSEGGAIAQLLLAQGIPAVTEDGLQACGNTCVRRAVAALRLTVNNDDPVARLVAGDTEPVPMGTVYEMAVAAIRMAKPQPGDEAYAQVLADQAMVWQQNHGSDLGGFLDWWEETGGRKCVGGGDRDAVRVMTIHKSKGLSLECVIIPLVAEKIVPSPTLTPSIWCRAEGRFADAGLMPVKAFEKTLTGTAFEGAFKEERALQWLDAVNTLYVAMTRAKSRLYVYMPEDDPTKAATRTGAIVQRVLPMEGGVWERGEETPFIAAAEEPMKNALMTGIMEGGRKGVTVALQADAYFAGEAEDVEF